MLAQPSNDNGVSILAIEAGLTAIAVGIAFILPRIGSSFFPFIERLFEPLSRRPRLSVVVVGLTALLLRLAILPLHPIPRPYYTDDFSFLFSGETFALGRLTNPTPVMWTHFETMHITMAPTYSSMFFPAQGLVLAAGKVLFGDPWFAMLLTSALMSAAICWMLQAWLPSRWALLGGMLAVVRLGVFSYWIDTYVGAGLLVAFAGALVLGAMPRLIRHCRVRDAVLLTTGLLILANSRPYEGILLSIPVALALGHWIFYSKRRPAKALLLRTAALPAVLLVVAGSWMAYYNYRNFGSPAILPYTIDRATYAVAPHFLWEPEAPVPAYRYQAIHDYYLKVELPEFRRIHSASGFLPQTLLKGTRTFLFFAEFALIPPLFMLRHLFTDRRIRFLLLCMIPLTLGLIVEAGIRPYYLAPFTAAFYALGIQAMRHLKHWKPNRQPVGRAILCFMLVLCFTMPALDLAAKPLHLEPPSSPGLGWACDCTNSSNSLGSARAALQAQLEHQPGKQLVLVRYSPTHDASEEWVYNSPDIDASKVIWAREAEGSDNQSQNQKLIDYYKDRQAWLIEPDGAHPGIQPYPKQPGADNLASATH
jgi:hypothetical protein